MHIMLLGEVWPYGKVVGCVAADLPTLPAVVPALQLLFQDSEKEEAAEAAQLATYGDADMAAELG